jgi:hypothetical protein
MLPVIGSKSYRVILPAMLVCDSHVAKIATIHGRIVVACFDGGIVDAVCGHFHIHQTLERSVLRGKACFDVVDAANAGQAASRCHRCASENDRLLHVWLLG